MALAMSGDARRSPDPIPSMSASPVNEPVVHAGLRAQLIVEDDVEEGTVHVQAAVILNETQLPEFVHEETHP